MSFYIPLNLYVDHSKKYYLPKKNLTIHYKNIIIVKVFKSQ